MGFDCARFVPALAAACLFGVASAPAFAAEVSPWDQDIRSAARLIAAGALNQSDGHVLRAGVEIKLTPGWKTYWRYPGDSGVPPVFDFSASDNVKAVRVLYPAPHRFDDGGGTSIGYSGGVIFPLQVTAQHAGRPVTLRMKLSYAACEKLCVPAKAQVELVLTDAKTALDATLAAFEARVPKLGRVGDEGWPSIRAVRREAGGAKPKIVVELAAPAGAAVDLFAEGPTEQWALPLPTPVTG